MTTPTKTGTAAVNGVEIRYDIYGEGSPLVMLHGGVNPSEMFGAPLAEMAKTHQVIAIQLRGHGFSTDADAPWTFEQMADDVAAVLTQIGVAKADFMGYSLGAGVAIQTTIRHPEIVGKLVAISAAVRGDGGDYPEVRAAFAGMSQAAPMIGQQIAGSPLGALYPTANWEAIILKTGEMNQPNHDWTADVAKIKAPTLLMFADADSVMLDHIAEFYKLLGGGQRDAGMDGSLRSPNRLAIIPNATHYNILQSPSVSQYATDFLAQ